MGTLRAALVWGLLVGGCSLTSLDELEGPGDASDAGAPDGPDGSAGVGGDASTVWCPTGQKSCGTCVSINDPTFGCGSADCSPCNLPNAVPICVGGECKIDKCVSGFDNCDSNSANGCEVNLSSDVAHCGGCGKGCMSLPNTQVECVNSGCSYVCEEGFENCDTVVGCETSLDSAQHCGDCNSPCVDNVCCSCSCQNGNCDCNCDPNCPGY